MNGSRTRWRKSRAARGSWLALYLCACGENGSSSPIRAGASAPVNPAIVSPFAPAVTPGVTSTASVVSTAPEVVLDEPPCEFASTADVIPTAVFDGLGVGARLPGRTLFSWTTLEQARELEAGGELLSRTERPGQGPGRAVEYLATDFVPSNDQERSLVDLLTSEAFAKARYAWPHAWATRMGWPETDTAPAESYGDQLLRLVVKPEARWVVVTDNTLWVFDNAGIPVDLAEALSAPSLIAGVYFQNGDGAEGGVECGTFGRASSAYREFIVMNPEMIESWSLNSASAREVVRTDLALLTAFFQRVRSCPTRETTQQWARSLICSSWSGSTGGEIGAYEQTLALANGNYLPQPAQIAAIIETLEEDLGNWTIAIEEEIDGGSHAVPQPQADSGVPGNSESSGFASSDAGL